MSYARSSISEFELANPLYVGASVTFYEVDVDGNKTTDLAVLYSTVTGDNELPNPQILDSYGKVKFPVYIDFPVIGHVVFPDVSVDPHDTGIIQVPGRNRGNYAISTLYYGNDLIVDPASNNIYSVLETYISSGSIAADVVAGKIELFLAPSSIVGTFEPLSRVTVTKTANYNLLAADCAKSFNNTGAVGAVIFALPASPVGFRAVFYCDAAQTFTVKAGAGTTIKNAADETTVAGNLTCNTPGFFLEVEGVTPTKYAVKAISGEWTVN